MFLPSLWGLWVCGTAGDSGAGCGGGQVRFTVVGMEQRGMESTSWLKDSPRSTGTVQSIKPKRIVNELRTECEAQGLQLKSTESGIGSESGDRRQKLDFGIQGESLYGVQGGSYKGCWGSGGGPGIGGMGAEPPYPTVMLGS